MMTELAAEFASWIGRTEEMEELLQPATAQAAAAMLDLDPSGFVTNQTLPPLWHWFCFWSKAPQSGLGPDGHPLRTSQSFLPPIPYPRRMFAGARLQWHRPLRLGQTARRQAVLRSITQKAGRSGSLAFINVGYRVWQDGALCLEEEQTIVYRHPGSAAAKGSDDQASSSSAAVPHVADLPNLPPDAWSRWITPDSRLLFRFSALTFNAHRIHYDRPYAMAEEGYPGLVVHGQLAAMLLLELIRAHTDRPIRAFSFRSLGPLFDLAPFRLVGVLDGDQVELEAQGPDGQTALSATAQLG
ncbi:MAG: MaoC family dehydratase N-terminal domain-containing protein [Pirellulaceae bacterium]|nr:MaoC family dehydratase N-terminal domain-containing protein [Pirellulaceae bacterium]